MFRWLVMMSVVLLVGCASAPKPQKVELPSLEKMMMAAEASVGAGKVEVAIAEYKAAAKAYPGRKEPWQKMAQIRFDTYQYGEAVLYAEEVLRLDRLDQLAHSIIAVSGLRLSSSSLGVLRRENRLSGTVKSEARGLAEVLRENLGVVEIVPQVAETPKKTKRKRRVVRDTESDAKPVRRAPPAKNVGDTANPFGSLE